MDRMWYENPGIFSRTQLSALRTACLSRIICDNTGITQVSRNPFSLPVRLVPCANIPRLNLKAWKDRSSETDTGKKQGY